MLATQSKDEEKKTAATRPGRLILFVAGGLLGLLAVAWIGVAIFVKHSEAYLKEQVLRDLRQRFDGPVEIGSFHATVSRTLRIEGENLVILGAGDGKYPPLIAIQHFDFAASPFGLLRWPLSVGSAHVSGMAITLPPRGQRPTLHAKTEPSGRADGRTLFVIHRVVAEGTRLELLTDKPGKLPLVFEIHR